MSKAPRKPSSLCEELPPLPSRRGRKRKAFTEEDVKKRKKENRDNCNRNLYGYEGFLISMLMSLGYSFKFDRISTDIKNQKQKIVEIYFGNVLIGTRQMVEDLIDQQKEVKEDPYPHRVKSTMATIMMDNWMVNVLASLGYQMEVKVWKNPRKRYVNPRLTINWIIMNNVKYTKKELIEIGFKFYESLRSTFNGTVNEIFSM